MNYNEVLYENLTASDLKHTAVLVLLLLVCFYLVIKMIGLIKKSRRKQYASYKEIEDKKKEIEKLLNDKEQE